MPEDTLLSQVGPFAMLPIALLDRCKDANAIHVYAILSRYSNRERKAWPGNERIAADMGASVRTVQRGLELLRTIGGIRTEPRRNGAGVIIGTQYVLLAMIDHTPRAAHGSQPVATRPTSTTRPNATGGGPATPRAAEELDPVNQIHKDEQDHSARVDDVQSAIEAWRARWTNRYGYAASLITSPKLIADVGRQLAAIGLDGWIAGLDGYFAADDEFAKRCAHGLNTFARDPSRWRVQVRPSAPTPSTANGMRQHTREANAGAVADGRLRDILARDNPEQFGGN